MKLDSVTASPLSDFKNTYFSCNMSVSYQAVLFKTDDREDKVELVYVNPPPTEPDRLSKTREAQFT